MFDKIRIPWIPENAEYELRKSMNPKRSNVNTKVNADFSTINISFRTIVEFSLIVKKRKKKIHQERFGNLIIIATKHGRISYRNDWNIVETGCCLCFAVLFFCIQSWGKKNAAEEGGGINFIWKIHKKVSRKDAISKWTVRMFIQSGELYNGGWHSYK